MRRPLRLFSGLTLTALALAGLAGLAGFALPPAAARAEPAPAAAHSTGAVLPFSVDDFSFASMDARYLLDRDDEGHSTLATTETLVARFPETDQNRGIRRNIPTHYRGQPTELSIDSVTDGNGAELDYETETISDDSDADYLSVTIADDDFVRGEQTYVISYTQRYVILFPDDSTDEEFYWEVNGTGWAQPFDTVTATVRVAPELVAHLTGRTACYQGGSESGAACDSLGSAADGDEFVIEASASDLAAREGLTLAVGFAAGTFVPRDDSFTANPFPLIGLLGTVAALAAGVVAVVVRKTRWSNAAGRPTIIPEYLPPAGVNMLQAGDVLGARATSRALTAQFLQFAVRGNVRVLEGTGKNHFLLELHSRDGLDETERGVLDALFPADTDIGAVRDLKKSNSKMGTALQKVRARARKRMLTDGLRENRGGTLRRWLITAVPIISAIAIVASIAALVSEVAAGWPALFLALAVLASIVTLAFLIEVRPLTARGAELRDYLKGVTVYISLAEADRLRVLQSPQGALRTPYRPVDAGPVTTEPVQVLKLYEKLLPLAVLTGEEKQWSRVLGDYYETTGQTPTWYVGHSPFSAAYFATAVTGFTTTVAASGSAGSSSSSGSSGGGSVSGGGGGGGGGGV
jgi:uncharacterized membrane protein YgcG